MSTKLIDATVDRTTRRAGVRAATRSHDGRLPDELLSEQVQRLAVFSAVGAGLWTFGLVDGHLRHAADCGTAGPQLAVDHRDRDAAAIVVRRLMFVYVRYASTSVRRRPTSASSYHAAATPSASRCSTPGRVPPAGDASSGCRGTRSSSSSSSMIMPTTPRQDAGRVAGRGVDGSARRLARAPARRAGAVGREHVRAVHCPNYACAVVAMLPSHVLQRLGRRLREAQELGSYQLVELLGRGGMGEVWRAEHRLLARERGDQAGAPGAARREQRGRGAAACCAGSSAKRRRRRR